MRNLPFPIVTLLVTAFPAGRASAHASEQGFVLLLPTEIYIPAGAATVALTVLLLARLPESLAARLFRPLPLPRLPDWPLRHGASCLSAALLLWLLWQGLTGPRDPLANPLPLMVWTFWWILLVIAQGLIGNHWRWLNPWTGPAALLHRLTGSAPPLRYPRRLGHGPGILGFLALAAFLLADPAPADPARLALVAGIYWYAALAGLLLFGPRFLLCAECTTLMMRAYRRMAVLGGNRPAIGLPGWQMLARPKAPFGLALFILILLGTGSFDGLHGTFFWFGLLGLNPLEFPGRSAVIAETIAGLLSVNLALIAAFTACLWTGERIAGTKRPLARAFRLFAPTVLPITLAYHIAHYLTALLVDGQYLLHWLNDPLQTGANLLGLAESYVTTGFFNTAPTVKAIFLTQAGVVVAGHVIAIALAHALAQHGQTRLRAFLSQAPLALFMVGYTFFGLWLLASPKGL